MSETKNTNCYHRSQSTCSTLNQSLAQREGEGTVFCLWCVINCNVHYGQLMLHVVCVKSVWQIKYTLLLLLCYNASIPISSFRINQIRTQKRIILWIHPNKCLSTQKQLYITHYWWVSTLVSHLQCTVNKTRVFFKFF